MFVVILDPLWTKCGPRIGRQTRKLRKTRSHVLYRPCIVQSYIVQAGWPRHASRRSGTLNIVPDTLNKAYLAVIKVINYLYKHVGTCRNMRDTRYAQIVLSGG